MSCSSTTNLTRALDGTGARHVTRGYRGGCSMGADDARTETAGFADTPQVARMGRVYHLSAHAGWTMEKTVQELRRLKAEGNCDVVALDYLKRTPQVAGSCKCSAPTRFSGKPITWSS